MMMVARASNEGVESAGHIATYASSALLIETGMNHFFHAENNGVYGDLVFFQGHASPGNYARALLEGRFSASQVDHFRQEAFTPGLSSYPHPWLLPDFWQFPTVSMGLGPLGAIYQARFRKYLINRGMLDEHPRKVWVFCGDGEMDEPESLGALSIASREKLSNLVFIVNCNQQRLDGPVRGNGKIVSELASIFAGAGWRVIKVIWNSAWDPLFAKDREGVLRQALLDMVDGAFQHFGERDAKAWQAFFAVDPRLQALVQGWTEEDFLKLGRGGHDFKKIYAAYQAAALESEAPVVLLPVTKKGLGMGLGEGSNTNHQKKKMNLEEMKHFAEYFDIQGVHEEDMQAYRSYIPDPSHPAIQYLHQKRAALGGPLPARRPKSSMTLPVPALQEIFGEQLVGSGDRTVSTTMIFVRCLSMLLRQPLLKAHVVPIVPDECRTFGMEGLFRQIGIYSADGQHYQPVDQNEIMRYHESKQGQLLQEGINEAGAMASWMAAASSYSNNNLPMIPFYIYYSMFGFQRVGDLWWAAADMRCRGFLLGATSGRTTLSGEGLQHQDGQTHLFASVIPNCLAYDPGYGYELAVIIHEGLRRMYQNQEDVFYYLSVMNDNYQHPSMPKGAEEGIIKGMYRLQSEEGALIHLLGSGAILPEVVEAARILQDEYQVAANVWSVTSYSELKRDHQACERAAWLNPGSLHQISYVASCLSDGLPVVAASDYVKDVPEQIRSAVAGSYAVLGTDGFGRSDKRRVLRRLFLVDAWAIVYRALTLLAEQGIFPKEQLLSVRARAGIDAEQTNPMIE